jgi:hypothetical protein
MAATGNETEATCPWRNRHTSHGSIQLRISGASMPRLAQNFVRRQLWSHSFFFPFRKFISSETKGYKTIVKKKKKNGESGTRCGLIKFCHGLGILPKLTAIIYRTSVFQV